MILRDVKNYLAEKITCDLPTLSIHFRCEPDLMRDLLGHWIRKGKIIREPASLACSACRVSCRSCDTEIYRYLFK